MLDYRMDTFLSLCETKSYTKTAEQLHLTQPSVTQHIKHLEQYYQCQLFRYDGRRVELTKAGVYLRDKVILQRAQNASVRKRLKELENPASLDIGMTVSATFTLAMDVLLGYVSKDAQPQIHLHVHSARQLLRQLQNGQLDAVIVEGETPNLLVESMELCQERMMGVAFPAIGRKLYGCSLSQLKQYPLIVLEPGSGLRTLMQRNLSRYGISFYDFVDVIEVDSLMVLLALLRRGAGVSFLLESMMETAQLHHHLEPIYLDCAAMYGSMYFVTMRERADEGDLWKIYEEILAKQSLTAGRNACVKASPAYRPSVER